MRERVDVDAVLQAGDVGRHALAFGPQDIAAARNERIGIEPDDARLKLVGNLRPLFRRYQHVAARDFDLVREHDRHRLALAGLGEGPVHGDDILDSCQLARLCHHDRIADGDLARGDLPGEAAEIEVRAGNILNGEAEGLVEILVVDGHGLQMLQQRRTRIPGHVRRAVDDIVAEAGRHRDRQHGRKFQAR